MMDIKYGALFPWHVRLVAVFTIIIALAVIINYWWISLLIFIGSFFVIVSHEGTEVDPINKTFRSYTSFLFFKTGDSENYSHVEKLFINSGKQSQKMYSAHTSLSTTVSEKVFNAYIKFSNGEKVHLLTSKMKEDVIKKLTPLSHALKVEIIEVA